MANKGHSTIIEFGDGADYTASTTWTKFGKVTDVTPPDLEAEDIDISHMESTNQFEEVMAGWASAGEAEITVQYDKTMQAANIAIFRITKGFRLTFSDASTWKWNGYVKKLGNKVERKGIVTQDITIKVSGVPVFAPAT